MTASVRVQEGGNGTTEGFETQRDAAIALNMISHCKRSGFDYIYDSSAGSGTFAYLIDTGILTNHEQFGRRAGEGYVDKSLVFGDESGHGTHVAGLVGGRDFGVTKQAFLISVKVMGSEEMCTGRAMLAGLIWAYRDIRRYNRAAKSVVNISAVGISAKRAVCDAIDEAAGAGISTVVAAGNAASDEPWQQWTSKSAIVVAATDLSYKRASFSNYGTAITLFAPGTVQSSWIGERTSFRTLSGTSQTTALVSGIVLLLKGKQRLGGARVMREVVARLATKGIVRDVGGSPNLLAYNGSNR